MRGADWIPVLNGEFDGRPVMVERHRGGCYRVTTTQKGDEISEMYDEGNAKFLPMVFKDGDAIEFDTLTIDDLAQDLLDMSFSAQAVLDIARRCREATERSS